MTTARAWRLGLLLGLALLGAALWASSCTDPVGRTELLRQIESGEAPTIVDVRSRSEFESGHVPGAVHVPFHAILAQTEGIPPPGEDGAPVVLYCERGPRAVLARVQLWLVSDRPVRFLEGHMSAWKRDDLPVAKAGGRWWR